MKGQHIYSLITKWRAIPDKTPTTIDTSMDAICGKTTGSIRIDSVHIGSSPYRFSLNNQGYQAATLFSNVPYGANILLAKDNFGCTTSQSVEVKYTRKKQCRKFPDGCFLILH